MKNGAGSDTPREKVLDVHPLIPAAVEFQRESSGGDVAHSRRHEHITAKGDIGDPMAMLDTLAAAASRELDRVPPRAIVPRS